MCVYLRVCVCVSVWRVYCEVSVYVFGVCVCVHVYVCMYMCAWVCVQVTAYIRKLEECFTKQLFLPTMYPAE